MLISQNQCNLRLPKYKESFTNIKFDYQKCIGIYEKAHLISDLKRKVFLAGAQTHEIDYFGPGYYLGWMPVILNLF